MCVYVCIYIYIFGFLEPQLRHMEVPRLGVKSELQLPATAIATATAMPELSHVCDPSSKQCMILNSLSKDRDQTHILMDLSWVPNPLSHNGNSLFFSFSFFLFFFFFFLLHLLSFPLYVCTEHIPGKTLSKFLGKQNSLGRGSSPQGNSEPSGKDGQ